MSAYADFAETVNPWIGTAYHCIFSNFDDYIRFAARGTYNIIARRFTVLQQS